MSLVPSTDPAVPARSSKLNLGSKLSLSALGRKFRATFVDHKAAGGKRWVEVWTRMCIYICKRDLYVLCERLPFAHYFLIIEYF